MNCIFVFQEKTELTGKRKSSRPALAIQMPDLIMRTKYLLAENSDSNHIQIKIHYT